MFPDRVFRLEHGAEPDVVLRHDAVDHLVRALGVRHRQLIELDQLLLLQQEPAAQRHVA